LSVDWAKNEARGMVKMTGLDRIHQVEREREERKRGEKKREKEREKCFNSVLFWVRFS